MTEDPEISPGTVSKILWHFTGGPSWNPATKRQNTTRKLPAEAYTNLISILRTKALRLGGYKEVVKVVLPAYRRIEPKTRKIEVRKNVPITLESFPICCVSDIPAPHLHYHAQRYGKFAVGFHRDAVIHAGFNPVFYTLSDASIIRSIYEGFSSVELADVSTIRDAASNIESEVSRVEGDHDDLDLDVTNDLWEIGSEVDSIEETLSTARESLAKFVAFVKTFDRTEFATIYCEREWRSLREFRFQVDDIAMVVLPRKVGQVEYFRPFVETVAPGLRLPRRVPAVAWDDLVEH
jgi:hypothetical protein